LLVRFLDLDAPGGDFSAELQEQDTSTGGLLHGARDGDRQCLLQGERPGPVGGAVMLSQFRAAGVTVDDRVADSEFVRFGWADDPEGNRFELWEPPTGS
jgi:hypothetical protein